MGMLNRCYMNILTNETDKIFKETKINFLVEFFGKRHHYHN